MLLGPASIDLLRQSSESLAGRVTYIDMNPFDVLEIKNNQVMELWLRGGFPDSFLAKNEKQSLSWRKDFIRSYLAKDIQSFGPKIPFETYERSKISTRRSGVEPETFERFWTMLANSQGNLLNASQIAVSLMISVQTVSRYIDLMVDLLLVRRLKPFHKNIKKRLVKSPKIYIRDSGIMHVLLGITDHNNLAGNPIVGNSWEGFVIENLLIAAPNQTLASFYRTAAGAEIDLILEIPGSGTWAIEIKRGLAPKIEKGFFLACEDIKPDKRFVVYSGEDRYLIMEGIEVVSLKIMAEILASLEL